MRRALEWVALLASVAGGAYYAWAYWPVQATYRLGVRLPEPGELQVGAAVRRGGLTIGRVTAIDDEGRVAVAWLAIGERHPVAAAARIDVAAFLGGSPYLRVRQSSRARARAVPGSVLEGAPPAEASGLSRAVTDAGAALASVRALLAAAERTAASTEAAARLERVLRTAEAAVVAAALASERAARLAGQLELVAGDLRGVVADVGQLVRAAGPGGQLGGELAATASRIASAADDVAAVTGRIRSAAEDPRLAALGEQVMVAAGGAAATAERARDWWEHLELGARSSTLYDLRRGRITANGAVLAGDYELGWEGGAEGGLTVLANRRFRGLDFRTGTLGGEPSLGLATAGGRLALDLRGLPRPEPRLTLRVPVSGRWSAEMRAEPDGVAIGLGSRW